MEKGDLRLTRAKEATATEARSALMFKAAVVMAMAVGADGVADFVGAGPTVVRTLDRTSFWEKGMGSGLLRTLERVAKSEAEIRAAVCSVSG